MAVLRRGDMCLEMHSLHGVHDGIQMHDLVWCDRRHFAEEVR